MYCPNCSSELEKEDFCPHCSLDVTMFKKALALSASYYNKALDQAGVNDLSGALQSLNKSITFNRNNIEARNLLGLVYFETGHIGSALKHWVISNSLNTEDNFAKQYIDYSQKNVRRFEQLNDSIKMYNKAITYISQKSDDMAVIQLKRAIDINPKFIDAYNLLVLCLIIQNEDAKALALVRKVLDMDVNNEIALNYSVYLGSGGGKFSKPDAPSLNLSKTKKTLPYDQGMGRSRKAIYGGIRWFEILSFVAGCLCTAAVMYILYMPSEINVREQKINNLENSIAKLEQHYEEQKIKDEEKIKELETDNQRLNEQKDALESEVEINSKVQKINTASNLYAQNKNEEAAVALLNMDLTNVPPEAVDNYNTLVEKIFPKLAQSLYSSGKSMYDRRNYPSSKETLEKALLYSDSVPVTKYNAMYYLGMICVADDDTSKAKEYFEQVEANHTSASMRSYAKEQLRKLNNNS